MFSIRSVARSGARAVPRLTATTVPGAAMARPMLKVTTTSFLLKNTAFSTSTFLREAAETAVQADVELSNKLQTELQFETTVKNDTVPVGIQEFLDNGPFTVTDNPERDDIVLSREFGDEKITVTFSIADLANYDAENEMFDEEQGEGEFGEGQRTIEDGGATEGETPAAPEARPPCRLHVVVEKPGKTTGALNIEATAADDGIMIESVYFYKDPKLAHANSPEAEFASQEVYPGPPFSSLDEDLQVVMERFLEERGVDEAMSAFASDYMEFKEQKEYMAWLANVKAFIDA